MLETIKRVHTLADGRELIYFDDADTRLPVERAADTRPPDQRPATATMRQDALTGDWITIAAARQNRVLLPPAELDPFSPQTPRNPTSEIPAPYDVAVIENRSPAFGPGLGDPGDLSGVGLNRSAPAVGRCEVVCFSPAPEGAFGSLSSTRARTVIEAWADRTAALSALPGIEQVYPFENRGEAIGVTIRHPHGQIYGYPYITPRTQVLIRSLAAYGPGLFADILASEQSGPRMLLRGEHWSAYVPFAPHWPLEVHLMPHTPVPDFAETTADQRDELAVIYLRLLRGLDALYPTPTPYIAAWHQAPVRVHRDDIRLHLQLTSPRRAEAKLKYLAGSETGMGAWVADLAPEKQAELLRAAIGRADRQYPA